MKPLFIVIFGLCCAFCLYSAITDPAIAGVQTYATTYYVGAAVFAVLGAGTLWSWHKGN